MRSGQSIYASSFENDKWSVTLFLRIVKRVICFNYSVLTTYLTPTSGRAYGNNGEIGLKTMRKGSKTAEKRSKMGTRRLEVCLGPGRCEFESRHSDLKMAEMRHNRLRFGLFLCIFEE